MATPKRSPLDEAPLADLVEEVSVTRHPDAPVPDAEQEAAAADRLTRIELIMRERSVPRAIAVIMVDKGYSRGTAFRIWNDEQKRLTQAREAAHAAQLAKQAKQPMRASGA